MKKLLEAITKLIKKNWVVITKLILCIVVYCVFQETNQPKFVEDNEIVTWNNLYAFLLVIFISWVPFVESKKPKELEKDIDSLKSSFLALSEQIISIATSLKSHIDLDDSRCSILRTEIHKLEEHYEKLSMECIGLDRKLKEYTWDCEEIFECSNCEGITKDFYCSEDDFWVCNQCGDLETIEKKKISHHKKESLENSVNL